MAGRGCDPGGKNRSGHQSAWTAVRIRESEMPVSSVRIEPHGTGLAGERDRARFRERID